MPNLYVQVVGANSAGKSTAARHLAHELDLDIVEFGELVRQEMRSRPDLGDDSSAAYMKLRSEHGSALLADWAAAVQQQWGSTRLLLVGVRDVPAFDMLSQAFEPLHVVAITAPVDSRLKRDAAKRQLDGMSPLPRSSFLDRDREHREWGLDHIVKRAHWTIANDRDLESLHRRLQCVARILKSKDRGHI